MIFGFRYRYLIGVFDERVSGLLTYTIRNTVLNCEQIASPKLWFFYLNKISFKITPTCWRLQNNQTIILNDTGIRIIMVYKIESRSDSSCWDVSPPGTSKSSGL